MKKFSFSRKIAPARQDALSSNHIMSVFFDMVPDLLCIATRDGYFKLLNAAWETTLGYPIQELMSRPFFELLHPDDVVPTMQQVESQFSGNETLRFLNRYRCKDNSYKWIEWRAKADLVRNERYAVGRDVTESYVSEQALRESEEKYEAAFKTSPDAININKMDGTYVDINNGFTEITGYTKEDVLGIGSLYLEIWAIPDDRRKLVEGLEKDGYVKNLESVFRCKDGTLLTALMSASLINIKNEPHILSVTRDISARKKDEDAIRESENRFRQIAENAEEMIWEVDVNGMYTFCNETVKTILGYEVNEVVGHKHFYDLFDPVTMEGVKEQAAIIFTNKESFKRLINYSIHKDGHIVTLETNGSPIQDRNGDLIGYRGTDTDISKRVLIEKALKDSEEKYRLLAVNSSDVIWTMNLNWEFTYVSPSIQQFRGFTPEEVVKTGFDGFLTPHSALLAKEKIAEYLPRIQAGERLANETFVFEVATKEGSTVWAECKVGTLYNDNNELLGVVGATRDITERIRNEGQLKNSEEIFRSLAEYSPNMIFIVIKNKIYYVNQLCEMKLGYTKEELYSPDFKFENLAAPEHRNLFNENILNHISGKEPAPFEFLMNSKQGRVLYTMVNTKLIQIGKDKAILGAILDISEQKWAEEILKRKATQFEQFSKIMVDRELKLVELKNEVDKLLIHYGEDPKYKIHDNK